MNLDLAPMPHMLDLHPTSSTAAERMGQFGGGNVKFV